MAEMTKRERVMAALRGDAVDRPPFSFWAHNYAKENSADDLAEETSRLAREFDFDFLKPQSRAQCFEEAWGAVCRASGQRTGKPTPLSFVVHDPSDYGKLEPVDPSRGSLGEQIEALKLIRRAVGPEVPIIWTIFNPLMIARRLAADDVDMLRRAMRERPADLEQGLEVIARSMASYARAAVGNGADGLFYATNVATAGVLTADEYRRFGQPFDRIVLDAVAGAPFTMLHTCGDAVYFDLFAGYPVQAFNWQLSPRNPTLSEAERRADKAVAGGVTTKPADLKLQPANVGFEVRRAIEELGGRHLLVAPGCSNSPEVADLVFGAARDAVKASAAD